MPKLILPVALLCALLTSFIARPADAAAKPPARVHVMIQLSGSPLATDLNLRARDRFTGDHLRLDPTLPAARAYLAALTRYQRQEIAYLRGRGIDLTVGRTFHVVWNGFDATVPASQLGKLHSLSNVGTILPMRMYHPLLDHSLPLVHAPEAWSMLGGAASAGRGEMIANIDTGIDISNPCFKDSGMTPPPFGRRSDTADNLKYTNNKVIVARAFGSDSAQQYSAADQQGHGTFSSAIEACDYNTPTPLGTHISGVAPAAYLLSYNVFPGSDASTSDSQILSALDSALLDGADVVNMSLGGTAGELRFDVEALAVSNAIKAGVPVVVSAGNAGPTPQSIASPASDPAAISVGAVSNSRGIFATVSVSGSDVPTDLQQIKASQGTHAFTGKIGPAPMVFVGLGRLPKDDPNDLTANDFAGKDLHGKIAVIQRGITFFETKINNAAQAGAIGAIIFDNRQEVSFGMDTKSATLPAMSISQIAGQQLISYLQSHPDAQVTMDSALTSQPTTPDVLSYFSSRGYGQDFAIKPDLVAPGQDIYSATESETTNNELYNASGFAVADGTSFSAPHVTGAVALVLQHHPKWTPAQVKASLIDTADIDVFLDQSKSQSPSVMQAGSGL
ncbi:MAG: S8 family serine peptidase, partial [Chloroflexota bacterium]|nr:S8 family serine peptidase [Chloroflexota bacterium]